jgi:chemotaxis family two-component system sensor kinase Cph1
MSAVVTGVLRPSPIRLRKFTWLLAGFWTFAIALVLLWEISDERQQAIDIARSEALGAWKKEAAVFRWAADVGRIYVPVTEKTAPDANLSYLPERDISTPSGHQLTLISPPMIMSQVHALPGEHSGLQGHITRLTPIRPQDAPDPWEKEAIETFEQGRKQIESEETIGGQRYFRLIRPLVIDKSCLICHAEQGYKVGDIHGGLSIAVPMASIWGEQMPDVIHRIVGYGGMWIVGLAGIALMSRRLGQQVSHRFEAEQ